jgi:cysteine desulfurase/selenocysteine lyase
LLTPETRIRDFPTLADMTYLNSAAEGIPPLSVGEALQNYFRDKQLGMDGRQAHFRVWEQTRALAAEFFGLTAAEVTLCSCSSEAYNLAALALRLRPGDEVVINDLDFPAGATPWLQADCPATVKLWRHRYGALRIEDLIPLLGPKTRLVNVSLVSFFNGFRLILPAVAEAVHRHSPALLAVDVTQALGRIPLALDTADLIISSTHKWILASHGGGLVGVPKRRAEQWTVPAGGWYHLHDPFGPERFHRAVSQPGAASFTVGMPNFPAVYAVQAGLEYIKKIGVEAIDQAARPLVEQCLEGLQALPIELLTPAEPDHLAGILAFRHPAAETLHRQLHNANVHVMSHAGRIRVAIHGYNTSADVERFLAMLHQALKATGSS